MGVSARVGKDLGVLLYVWIPRCVYVMEWGCLCSWSVATPSEEKQSFFTGVFQVEKLFSGK